MFLVEYTKSKINKSLNGKLSLCFYSFTRACADDVLFLCDKVRKNALELLHFVRCCAKCSTKVKF